MSDYTNISTVDTCKEIRKSLAELFPRTKFRVQKNQEYSIYVDWQDGPGEPEVSEVLNKFLGYGPADEYGTTKRLTFYRERKYWSYNLKYINASRGCSRPLVEAITRYIVKKHGLNMPTISGTPESAHVEDDDQSIGTLMLSQYIHRFMHKASAIWLKDPKSPADKFRQWADGLQKQIDDKRRPRPTHTHRMARMAESARDDALRLELVQDKLRALADAWDAGIVPDPLRYVNTKAQVMYLARTDSAPRPNVNNDNYDNKDYKAFVKAGLGAQKLYYDAYRELYLMGDENAGKKSQADIIKEKEIALTNSKIPGFFPTPDGLIQRMLQQAGIQSGDSVLEPSAGKGNIAEKIKSAHPDADLDVVEWNHSLNELLKLKKFNVIGSDCFALKPETKQYEVILSNPPFEKYADIDHVLHYYELLKPGGRLVSIMSASPFKNSNAKANLFREWLDDVGYGEEMPDGAFLQSERKTGVKTYMIVVDKPEKVADTIDNIVKPDFTPTVSSGKPRDYDMHGKTIRVGDVVKCNSIKHSFRGIVTALADESGEYTFRDVGGTKKHKASAGSLVICEDHVGDFRNHEGRGNFNFRVGPDVWVRHMPSDRVGQLVGIEDHLVHVRMVPDGSTARWERAHVRSAYTPWVRNKSINRRGEVMRFVGHWGVMVRCFHTDMQSDQGERFWLFRDIELMERPFFQKGDFVKNLITGTTGWLERQQAVQWIVKVYHRERSDIKKVWNEHDLVLTPAPSIPQLISDIKLIDEKLKVSSAKVKKSLELMGYTVPKPASKPEPEETPKQIAEKIVADLEDAIEIIKPMATPKPVTKVIRPLASTHTAQIGQRVVHRLLDYWTGTIVKLDKQRGCLVQQKDSRSWFPADHTVLLDMPDAPEPTAKPVKAFTVTQYFELKKHYKDDLMLARVGETYEAYADDAQIVAKTLDTHITSRDIKNNLKIAVTAFSANQIDKNAKLLNNLGYTVVINHQHGIGDARWTVCHPDTPPETVQKPEEVLIEETKETPKQLSLF